VATDNAEDLEWLDELITNRPQYSRYDSHEEYAGGSWSGSWEPVRAEHIYVKIDDDVVFFEDHTIESIVSRLKENPQLFAVSANVVNNPMLGWIHLSMGLIEPFLPVSEIHGN
jgi:hypothetical protein